MRRTRFDDWDCPVARTVDILGDWWTPLVIRSAFLGARRFEDFTEALDIARNVLTERLKRLTEEGILRRVAYQDRPIRHEYRLTEKGLALYPVIVSLLTWGNDWLDWDGGDSPVSLVDRTSGAPVTPVMVDASSGERLGPRSTRVAYDGIENWGRPESSSR